MVNGILVSGIGYWRRNTRAGVKASGRAEITSRALQESTELDVAVSIPFTLVVPYEWHLLPLRVHFWHVHGKYISVKSLTASIATTDYGGPADPRSFQTQSCFSEACFVNSAQQALHNFCTQKPGTVEVGAHPWYLTIRLTHCSMFAPKYSSYRSCVRPRATESGANHQGAAAEPNHCELQGAQLAQSGPLAGAAIRGPLPRPPGAADQDAVREPRHGEQPTLRHTPRHGSLRAGGCGWLSFWSSTAVSSTGSNESSEYFLGVSLRPRGSSSA